jgi:hypothetical protein
MLAAFIDWQIRRWRKMVHPGAGRRRQLRETIVLILSFRQDALSHSMTEFIAVLNSLRFWCDVLKRMFASSI